MSTDARYTESASGGIVEGWAKVFQRQKAFAEHAFDQLDDAGFFWSPGQGLNCVAVIAQHLISNLKSRWDDFLSSDGEKSWRDRDAEFVIDDAGAKRRAVLMHEWHAAWQVLFGALSTIKPEDIDATITIRGVPHPVHLAVARQIDHYGFHVGQINVIARLHVGTDAWKWFTIPPGGSEAFNASLKARRQK